MFIKIFRDEASYVKTIPFEVEIDGEIYEGVITETISNVGGEMLEHEYEITWTDEEPDVDEDIIIQQYQNNPAK